MRLSLIERPAPLPFVAKTRAAMGQRAAEEIAGELLRRLDAQRGIRMIFAAAPSQSEMLSALMLMPGVAWPRVVRTRVSEARPGVPGRLLENFGDTTAFFGNYPGISPTTGGRSV